MSNTTQCMPKRKRGEQSAEEPAVVRRSARQKAKGQESIMERAMNRKKASSLETNSSSTSQTPKKGSGRTAQADSANIAGELQPPPAATSHRINRSRATLARTGNQANSVSRNHVSDECPAGLNPQALEFQSACTVSSKDEVPNVHSQGKLGASSYIFVPWTENGAHKLLPNKSHAQSSTVTSDKSKYNDPCKTNCPKHHHPEKPVSSSLKHGYVNHGSIRSSSETATRVVSQSNISGSNHTTSQPGSCTATIAGIRSASTNRVNRPQVAMQTAHARSGSAATSDPFDPNIFAHDSQMMYFPSIPTIPAGPLVAPRGVPNPRFQMIPPRFRQGKDAVSLRPAVSITHALNAPVEAIHTAATNRVNQSQVSSQTAHAGSGSVAISGPFDPSIVAHDSQRIYSPPIPTTPASPMVAHRGVANPSFQMIPPHFRRGKDAVSLPPAVSIKHSLNAPVQGIRSVSTNRVSQSQVAIQTAHAASGSAAISDPFDPNIATLDSQRIYSSSIPTIPASPMVATRGVTNPSFQMISPHFSQGKDAVSLPPAVSIIHSLNAPIQGRRTSANHTTRQFAPGGSNLVKPDPQRTYSPSSATSLQLSTIVPRVAIPPHSGLDKRTELSLPPTMPTMSALKVPAQGIRCSSSTAGHQYDVDKSKLMSTKSYAGCTTKSSPVPENKALHKNVVAKNRSFNENDVVKATNVNEKSVLRSSKPTPTYYIKSAGTSQMSTSSPPLLPLGERCHLCGIDLAFAATGSDSQTDDPPFAAVLPCSHSYHDHCITNVFGACEPPCVRCMEIEPPQGS